MPFADVARQYAALFEGTSYKVVTVFLTGEKNQQVVDLVGGEVIFLENTSRDVRGLKIKQIRQLREICRHRSFSFAIAHRFKPLYIASYIKNLPLVGVFHAFGDYSRYSRRWHAQWHKDRINLIANSDSVRDDIRSYLPDFPKEKIQTLYNRIDYGSIIQQLYSRTAAREKLGLDNDSFIFANVGRLHPDKDQSTLLKAFAACYQNLPDSKLVIIGQGRLEKSLIDEAWTLGISDHVQFLGKVEDAWRYFRAFDCFTLSSDREPFGMVLLEAMVAGIPVIATDCGGAPEVVGNTGFLTPFGCVDTMAQKMSMVYNLPLNDRKNLKPEMMKRVVDCFSDQAIRKQFWELSFIKPYQSTSNSNE
ncbi:glycosyltransferase [Endozoicomonadaceae bacterium StTr2]